MLLKEVNQYFSGHCMDDTQNCACQDDWDACSAKDTDCVLPYSQCHNSTAQMEQREFSNLSIDLSELYAGPILRACTAEDIIPVHCQWKIPKQKQNMSAWTQYGTNRNVNKKIKSKICLKYELPEGCDRCNSTCAWAPNAFQIHEGGIHSFVIQIARRICRSPTL